MKITEDNSNRYIVVESAVQVNSQSLKRKNPQVFQRMDHPMAWSQGSEHRGKINVSKDRYQRVMYVNAKPLNTLFVSNNARPVISLAFPYEHRDVRHRVAQSLSLHFVGAVDLQ